MPSATPAPRAVLLPGSGSDEVFVHRVFAAALRSAGVHLHAVAPDPRHVVASSVAALDDAAARPGPLLVGGISLGAAVATGWALAHPGRVDGLLLALPAWWGAPGGAPAAVLAAHSAAGLRAHGLGPALEQVRRGSPPWLAAELARAWTRQWPHLPDALEQAAAHVGPTAAALAGLDVPVGVAAAVDDPVHPVAVALELAARARRVGLARVTLAQVGADPATLGRAVVRAWRQAGG